MKKRSFQPSEDVEEEDGGDDGDCDGPSPSRVFGVPEAILFLMWLLENFQYFGRFILGYSDSIEGD